MVHHPCRGNISSDLPLPVVGVGCVLAKMMVYQRLTLGYMRENLCLSTLVQAPDEKSPYKNICFAAAL